MNRLKKLILTMLLLCSTTTFANTGGGGFDSPMEAFNFYYKLAEKARIYKNKHGHYNKKHINALAPHVWATNKDYKGSAGSKLGHHRSFVLSSRTDKHPLIVDMKYRGPIYGRSFKAKGIVKIPYTYFRYQQKGIGQTYADERSVKIRAKKIKNKIKWYIYQ